MPQISTTIDAEERWEHFKCRVSAYRNDYRVLPGLYAIGNPNAHSDVIVTANYKLTFDAVRQDLAGQNLWLLVLDTKGINVWCAAGKGTFGTEELVSRIGSAALDRIVDHRRLIVPQFGAVGVSGYKVLKATGFRVLFGPVRSSDLPEYLAAGHVASEEMRRVRFPMRDRFVLTPMEISPAMKKYPYFAFAVLLLFGLQPQGIIFRDAFMGGMPFLMLGILAIISGAFMVPLLLPYVPFRSFALKGLLTGGVITAAFLASGGMPFSMGIPALLAALIFFPIVSSYLALQFTGSTTYTNMSGVNKELRTALPVYIGGAAFSVVLLLFSKLRMWGVL